MAFFTLLAAGTLYDVLAGSIALDLSGVPTASLMFPDAEAPDVGPAELLVAEGDAAPVRFVGTVTFVRSFEGSALVEWSGGAAGLDAPAEAAHYTTIAQPVALVTVVEQLVEAAGEALDEGSLDALAGLVVDRWTRLEGETWGSALSRALEGTGRTWRILDSGRLWIGEETWPEVELGGVALDEDLGGRAIALSLSAATARPGTSYEGRHVVRVTFDSSGRALLDLDEDAASAAALRALLAPPDLYSRVYLAEVVKQHPDDSIDVRLLDDGAEPWRPLPVETLERVPFWTGVQGARYVLPVGAHVQVAFRQHSPAGAFAFGRPAAVGAERGVARIDDISDAGTLDVAGAPAGLVLTYTPPTGETTVVGVITAAAGMVPVVFTGVLSIPLRARIVSASEEVFLQ